MRVTSPTAKKAISHEDACKAADYAVDLHCLEKSGLSEFETDRVKTLLSLGAFRAIEYLNKLNSKWKE